MLATWIGAKSVASSIATREPLASSMIRRFWGSTARQSAALLFLMTSLGSVAFCTGEGRQKV